MKPYSLFVTNEIKVELTKKQFRHLFDACLIYWNDILEQWRTFAEVEYINIELALKGISND